MLVYFAHPAFSDSQKEFSSKFLDMISTNITSIEILNPFVFSPNIEGDREAKKVLGKAVLKCNLDLIDKSDIILACIDDKDQGVLIEIGYGLGINIPVITISQYNYDINIMLSGSVLAHLPNILEDFNFINLKKIFDSLASVQNVRARPE